MRNLFTRLLILSVLLAAYYTTYRGGIGQNIQLLLVLIFSLLFSYLPYDARPWRALLWLTVSALAVRFGTIALFLPLLLYDGVLEALTASGDEAPRSVFVFAPALMAIPLLIHFHPQSLLFCLLSAAFAWYSFHLDRSGEKLHRLRDDLEEQLRGLHTDLRRRRLEEEKERHITRLDERDRISRELHDVTGHTLSSALLQVAALEVINREEALKKPLEQLRGTLNNGMSDIRRTLHAMHAEACNLERELDHILAAAASFKTRLNCHAPENLPLQIKLDLIAIAREAVTNAMRHSAGQRLEITLLDQPSLLSLSVWDDGEGFDPGHVKEGMGIANIRSIVERNRGLLNLTRVPGKGFAVHAVFLKEKKE